jgi:hypothetical protein
MQNRHMSGHRAFQQTLTCMSRLPGPDSQISPISITTLRCVTPNTGMRKPVSFILRLDCSAFRYLLFGFELVTHRPCVLHKSCLWTVYDHLLAPAAVYVHSFIPWPSVLLVALAHCVTCCLQVLFKDPTWQALTDEERLLFLEKGTCPGKPNTPLNMLCRNHWMHYLVSYVQPWEPLEKLLDAAHSFVQNQSFLAVSVVTK